LVGLVLLGTTTAPGIAAAVGATGNTAPTSPRATMRGKRPGIRTTI